MGLPHTRAHTHKVVKSQPPQTLSKEAGCSYGNLEKGEMTGLDLLRACMKPGVRFSHSFPYSICMLMYWYKKHKWKVYFLIFLPLCWYFSCSLWALCRVSGWCVSVVQFGNMKKELHPLVAYTSLPSLGWNRLGVAMKRAPCVTEWETCSCSALTEPCH